MPGDPEQIWTFVFESGISVLPEGNRGERTVGVQPVMHGAVALFFCPNECWAALGFESMTRRPSPCKGQHLEKGRALLRDERATFALSHKKMHACCCWRFGVDEEGRKERRTELVANGGATIRG